jgi:hypothetical protein
MWGADGEHVRDDVFECDTCKRMSCLFRRFVQSFGGGHERVNKMLRALLQWRKEQKQKVNLYVSSGILHDLALKSPEYIGLSPGTLSAGI